MLLIFLKKMIKSYYQDLISNHIRKQEAVLKLEEPEVPSIAPLGCKFQIVLKQTDSNSPSRPV